MIIRVIVAETSRVLSEGLAQGLQEEPELAASPATGSLEEALASCRERSPSVLLASECFLETVEPRRLRDQIDCGCRATVLVLASGASDDGDLAWLRLGCMGRVSRSDSIGTVKMAIRAVAGGQIWAPRTDLAALLRELLLAERDRSRDGRRLTAREEQILALLAEGASNDEIADRLFISLETVRWHVRRLARKSGARDRAALAVLAHERGLVWRARASAMTPFGRRSAPALAPGFPPSQVGISSQF